MRLTSCHSPSIVLVELKYRPDSESAAESRSNGPCILLLWLVVCKCHQPQPFVELNRATFQTALASATLSGQNFDSLSVGDITTVNGVTYTPSGCTAVVTVAFSPQLHRMASVLRQTVSLVPTETLTLMFASPITAFALDINTFATNSGDYQAAVNDGAASVIPSVFDVFPNTETGQFIGFTDSSSFTQVLGQYRKRFGDVHMM